VAFANVSSPTHVQVTVQTNRDGESAIAARDDAVRAKTPRKQFRAA